jgi:hypothetical protein
METHIGNATMPVNSFNYLAAFYGREHEPEKFVGEVDSLLAIEPATVRAIPFGCNQASIDWLAKNISGDKEVTLLYRKESLFAFRLNYKFTERGQEKNDTGRFFVMQQRNYPNAFVAVSLESTLFFRRALLPFLQSLYPTVMLTFIKHRKMKRLLDTFKRKVATPTSS